MIQCTSPFIGRDALQSAKKLLEGGALDSVFSARTDHTFRWAPTGGDTWGPVDHAKLYRLFKSLDEFAELMGDDEDFLSRVGDLRGIAARISGWVRGIAAGPNIPQEGSWIIVAEDLTPLETSQFGSSVVGVVTELGGPTSHTAIICRALSLPALVSAKGAMTLTQGESVLVDPEGNRVVQGGSLREATQALTFIPRSDAPLITVRANIGGLPDAIVASETSARGVGLFRTEVLYLSAQQEPTFEEQARSYSEIFRAAPAGKIIIRTIDAGSDKPVPFLTLPTEENPALGIRGFRLNRDHEPFIATQIKAIGHAIKETGRDVGVMAPMVSTVSEVEDFATLCAAADITQVGIMIETPANCADVAGPRWCPQLRQHRNK